MSNIARDYNKAEHEARNTKAAAISANQQLMQKATVENVLAKDAAVKGRS